MTSVTTLSSRFQLSIRNCSPEDRSDQAVADTQKCIVVPLDMPLALRAAEPPRRHKLATADAIVYATAQARGRRAAHL